MGCSPSFTWWMHDCFPQDPPLMEGVSAGNRSLWIRFNLPSVWHKENNEQTEPLLSWQWSRSQRADAYLWLRQSSHISFYRSNLKTLLIYLISKKRGLCCLIEGTTYLVLLNTRALIFTYGWKKVGVICSWWQYGRGRSFCCSFLWLLCVFFF